MQAFYFERESRERLVLQYVELSVESIPNAGVKDWQCSRVSGEPAQEGLSRLSVRL